MQPRAADLTSDGEILLEPALPRLLGRRENHGATLAPSFEASLDELKHAGVDAKVLDFQHVKCVLDDMTDFVEQLWRRGTTCDRKEETTDEEKKKLEHAGQHAKAAILEAKMPLHANNACQVAEERTIIHSSDGTWKTMLEQGVCKRP